MATKEELEFLREEVRRRHKAATNKVSRLKTRGGVVIGGTNNDVRRDLKKVKRYNAAQLKSYLTELNTFTSRGNSVLAGSRGTPISAAAWREYKRQENIYNSRGVEHISNIKDVFIPARGIKLDTNKKKLGLTVGERETAVRSDRIQRGQATARPYEQIRRTVGGITSEENLRKLTKDLERKNKSTYAPNRIRKQRKQLYDMLKDMGDPNLLSRAKKLRNDQFDILFNYTTFANDVSLKYLIMKKQNEGEGGISEEAITSISDGAENDINELLQWAQFLPEQNTKPNKRKKGSTRIRR